MVDAFYAVWILDAGNFYGKTPKYNKKNADIFPLCFVLVLCVCVKYPFCGIVYLILSTRHTGRNKYFSMVLIECEFHYMRFVLVYSCLCVCVSLCPNFMIYQSLVDYGRVFFSTFARHLSHHISMFRWRQSIILAAAIILHHIIPQHANERRKKHIN